MQNFTETAYGVNMDMIWVEGGSFMMGCTSEQGSNCDDAEKPADLCQRLCRYGPDGQCQRVYGQSAEIRKTCRRKFAVQCL